MQTLLVYVDASSTLGIIRDYANAKTQSAPVLTKGVEVALKLRLFAGSSGTTPYPIEQLRQIAAWQWVMDDDFDSSSSYILVGVHDAISVQSITENINGEEYIFSEITIPIRSTNTTELNALLATQESVANLNGELVGVDETGNEIFVLQLKGFSIRNRISSTGNPTEINSEYLTGTQVRAMFAAGLEMLFAGTASDSASEWHAEQTEDDRYFRVRLRGDTRTWDESTNPADAGWSDPLGLVISLQDKKNEAVNISVEDAANYYEGITVESVLQEIAERIENLRQEISNLNVSASNVSTNVSLAGSTYSDVESALNGIGNCISQTETTASTAMTTAETAMATAETAMATADAANATASSNTARIETLEQQYNG